VVVRSQFTFARSRRAGADLSTGKRKNKKWERLSSRIATTDFASSGKSVDRFDGVHVAQSASNGAKTRARRNEFRELIQADLGCQSSAHKYFAFRKSEIVYSPHRPASARGAYASSRTWGGMRWTLMARETNALDADGEIVWS
jgi:hypothetical protein